MVYRLLADAVLLLHLAFVLFAALGAFIVLRWPRLAWLHLPAVAWGAFVELTGRLCPLTPLENRFRAMGGGEAYAGDFIGRYLLPLIYPEGLTRDTQVALGLLLLAINVAAYAWLWHRWRRR